MITRDTPTLGNLHIMVWEDFHIHKSHRFWTKRGMESCPWGSPWAQSTAGQPLGVFIWVCLRTCGERPEKLLNPSRSMELIITFPTDVAIWGFYQHWNGTAKNFHFGRQGFEATPGAGPSISGLLPPLQEIKLDQNVSTFDQILSSSSVTPESKE